MSNTKRRFFLRYISIIQKLRSGEASFDEIKRSLDKRNEISGEEFEFSKRTFQRDLVDIRSIFDIDIRANARNNYYITEEEGDDFHSRMLETFDQLDLLYRTKHKSNYVYYEKRRLSGTEHFYGLLHAIHNRFVVRFVHEKFWNAPMTERYAEPIALKESQHRWYLLAKDRKDSKIKTFGMDRISQLAITKEKFKYPKDLDVDEIFRYCFGVISEAPKKPSEIVLSFDPEQRKYLHSLRIHPSQKVILENENEYRIGLTMYITYDLIKELCSYGSALTVISPNRLKKEILAELKNALSNYES